MPQLYYMVLTAVGAAKKTNKEALGQSLELTELAVGDGGGVYVAPDILWTELTNEVDRVAINQIYQDPDNLTYLVIEAIIPQDIPVGYYVREVGIFDIDGDMIMAGAYPQTYKPTLEEGAARDLYIRAITEIGSAASVELKVDPSIVLATRKFVADSIQPLDLLYAPINLRRSYNPLIGANFSTNPWQRGTLFAVTASGDYIADRWRVEFDGAPTITCEKVDINIGSKVLGVTVRNALKVTITNKAAASYIRLGQRIESVDTLAGDAASFSCAIQGSTVLNIPLRAIQHFGTGGAPSIDVVTPFDSVLAVTAALQELYSGLTLPGLAGKTYGLDGNDFVEVQYDLSSMDTGDYLIIPLGGQLDKGSVSSDFESLAPGDVRMQAQRYYYDSSLDGQWGIQYHGKTTSGLFYRSGVHSFPVSMRAVPTIASTNSSVSGFDVVSVIEGATRNGLAERRAATSTADDSFWRTNYTASAEL